MILLIFMIVLVVVALTHRDVRSRVRDSLGLGRKTGQAGSPEVAVATFDGPGWSTLDDLQLIRLLKDSA